MDAVSVGAAGEPFDREFEAITAGLRLDSEIAGAEQEPAESPAEPAPKPQQSPQPASSQSALEQAGGDYDLLRPPAPQTTPVATLPDVEAPPELTEPPRPKLKTSRLLQRWANAFPHLIWLSVIAGLLGQVYGWTIEFAFAGPYVAVAVAVTLGGTFEFIMVAASSRGLRDIGLNRPMWQCVAFLAVGTACAGLAFWMCLHHFNGSLMTVGQAAAAATAIGYLAHVKSHLFDELDNRRLVAEWERECERVRAEIQARHERARAEHDAYQAQVRKARLQSLQAETRRAARAADAADDEEEQQQRQARRQHRRAASLPEEPDQSGGRKLTREVALETLGEDFWKLGPAEINRRMSELGYQKVDPSTIRRWRQNKTEAA
ncbi:hypothetical protein [Sphaerobacter thermophilus]|uniref:hypothetical protein n=1 Tax=Sphaerobacter thermophilus TaxID=2057 RepID=UPI0039C28344